MSTAIISGSGGLIGSEAAMRFSAIGLKVVGLDNDMRRTFFGDHASTEWSVAMLKSSLGSDYEHRGLDVRDREGIMNLFRTYGQEISVVVHTAAQPSHDWAMREPFTDFDINAVGTLNLLEATRLFCPEAVFMFTSTNKVYGDRPNSLPFAEEATRWEILPTHHYAQGITEEMSIDDTTHSLFGASKTAADVLVQEYGRYFGMKTACFRGGTLTGPRHSATELHGFLAYIMRCAMTKTSYTIFGYKGKQVRDAIHCTDFLHALELFFRNPRVGEVYNIGGGRQSNASVVEAISLTEAITGNPVRHQYSHDNRVGDHIWWIGSNQKFQAHYPQWHLRYDIRAILTEMFHANEDRWSP